MSINTMLAQIAELQAEVEKANDCARLNAEHKAFWHGEAIKAQAENASLQSWQEDTRTLLQRWLDLFGSTNIISEATRIAIRKSQPAPLIVGRPDGTMIVDGVSKPIGEGPPAPLAGGMKTWQHEDTGRMCEKETSPGSRWFEVSAIQEGGKQS